MALENRAVQVALGNRVAQVASGNPAVLVESDQQDAPAAERVPDRRLVRAERTASEIAAFPAEPRAATRLAVVDLEVVQPGQPAVGAARAWVAAGTAAAAEVTAEAAVAVIAVVVVVAVAAAAAVAVAVGGGGGGGRR